MFDHVFVLSQVLDIVTKIQNKQSFPSLLVGG